MYWALTSHHLDDELRFIFVLICNGLLHESNAGDSNDLYKGQEQHEQCILHGEMLVIKQYL